ncbi:MAG: formate dehydrogenase major subunit, partial [Solirubrobacteraceae bacterium]|nr:formate dehydrogenase major subunit [Solirubrobacteraceae bacterium]
MAECHPVGFQWVVEAKARGAKVIHVDPRFSRTSALADRHVPLRTGTDIAWLGGLINHVLTGGHEFREYVVRYTNAATIVSEDYVDSDDLDGLFSGFDPGAKSYDVSSWRYAEMEPPAAAGEPSDQAEAEQSHGAHGAALQGGKPPEEDETLEHPRCVFQILKRHFSRYTPELVESVCGVPAHVFGEVADTICANSGRERTTAFVYSVGWTQRTTGVQYIRAASILQLLLGNIGRPGGGILALRGHASIQGSTDIPTLYNILPGYLPMPKADPEMSLERYIEQTTAPGGFWGHSREYIVSLLKAWWGDAATAGNDFCFDLLPRINGDHSIYPTIMDMRDGKVDGFFVMGENPAVGSANGKLHRMAMANLKWLVVRDLQMIESATFWQDGPEVETGELTPEEVGTEIFFLPAAAHTEKDGSFTNTQRLLQWHNKAVEPPDDCRSELSFMFHLGRRIREKLAGSADPRDRAILDLTWDYPVHGPTEEPDAEAVLREISGFEWPDGKALSGYTALAGDGSTACGCWIYSGVYADEENKANRRPERRGRDQVAADWAWAWPLNRRILYNRASADPDGRPWSLRKAHVWWDEDAGKWTGKDVPDFVADMPPSYRPPEGAKAEHALRGDEPFVMQADGRGWLYAPTGLTDGPLPTHYEPRESPFENKLHGQRANPTTEEYDRPDNRYHPAGGEPGADVYPYVISTYRIAEHHTAGGMSRTLPHLAELAPEPFVEVSPALAAERGLEHNGWATIISARTAIEARVMVTERIPDLLVQGRRTHQVGLPYHWGWKGLATGDSANDLLPLALDSNVHISEFKAATCDVRPGRRPRGPALLDLVAEYRTRAGRANADGGAGSA